MTPSTAGRPPAGMPPHLWELAKSDARGAVPERVRAKTDNGASAPAGIRAVARRAATAAAVLGAGAAAVALGATTVAPAPEVGLAGFDAGLGAGLGAGLDGPVPGSGSAGPDGAGHTTVGDHGGTGASHHVHGSLGDGPVSSGTGSTFQVHHPDAPGPQHTISISIFQDVTVVETADGNFQVDAYQYIVIHDSEGHEYVFTEHYQVTVPDPPGQETDLSIHETGHVHVVENPDGSFTPIAVDHGIVVTVGADGDGRDEVGIRQDESVHVEEHGRPDPHDTTVTLGEHASSTTHDTGDPAYTEIDQSTAVGEGRGHPVVSPMVLAPSGGTASSGGDPGGRAPGPPTADATVHPQVFGGHATAASSEPGPFTTTTEHGAGTSPGPGASDAGRPTSDGHVGDGAGTGGSDATTHGTPVHEAPEPESHETSGHEDADHESNGHAGGHESGGHDSAPSDGTGHTGTDHLVPTH